MFKNILFATSLTKACDPAARVAFNMSGLYEAGICVFHALETADTDTRRGEEKIRTRYADYLTKVQNFEIVAVPGDPCGNIFAQAQKQKPDLVVMGVSAGETGTGPGHDGENAGSTLLKVVRQSEYPVLVVNRAAASFWGAISNVVFATDFSLASDQAFEFSCRLVRNTRGELHVFHSQNTSLTPDSQVFNQDAIEARIREKLRFSRKKYAARMKDIPQYHIEVWEGTPFIEIVKYARDKYADLIILAQGPRGAGDDADPPGNTIRQVILRAGCPVLCMPAPKQA